MKIILTRPQYEITTKYLSCWAGEIIILANKKGAEVLDLAKEKARKNELVGRIKKLRPDIVFLNGHGNDDCIAGHNDEVLIKFGDNHKILSGVITYGLSCNAGKKLGPAVVKEPQTSFIGYTDKFIFICDNDFIFKPLQDPKAKPFMDSSNQVMVSLIKGNSVKDASLRSKDKFKENYLKFLSNKSDPDSLQIAQCLWWDMRHQVCLESDK
ncbi:MAG: hypothetical protein PHW31_00130 [Candidatus Pacebacteria bacterium]|nr:hypothetical protein [Candidatus Paceibacterota bacterium]